MAKVNIFSVEGKQVARVEFDFHAFRDTTRLVIYSIPHIGFVRIELGVSVHVYDLFDRKIGQVTGESIDRDGHYVLNKYSSIVGRMYPMSQFYTLLDPTIPVWDWGGEIDLEGKIWKIHPEGNGVFIPVGYTTLEGWEQNGQEAYRRAAKKYAEGRFTESGTDDLQRYIPEVEMKRIAGGAAFILGCFRPPKPKGLISRLLGL